MSSAITRKRAAVVKFKEAFACGIEHIIEAAAIYVKAIDSGDITHEDFQEAVPGIPPAAWNGLEAVGRGWLDRRLLWGGGRAASYLKRLPPSDQTAAFDNGLKMLLANGDAILVKPELMTREQCEQIFADNHVRTAGEQRVYLESKKVDPVLFKTASQAVAAAAVEVVGKKLVVRSAVTFTTAELRRFLGMMK